MGRAIALNLAHEGATIVCSDLRPEANPKGWEEDVHIPTHEVINNNGGTAIFVKADVSKTFEMENLISISVNVCEFPSVLIVGVRKVGLPCKCRWPMATVAAVRGGN
jgi:NAD(P)-dependent dehydrogenase (short-subunit alcohol dehydrogenase family)